MLPVLGRLICSAGFPAQLKAVIDRTFTMKNQPLKGKLGGAVSVVRITSRGVKQMCWEPLTFLPSSAMLCVPGELNGVTVSADKPGDVLKQPNRLEQARILGRNITSSIRV
jgi:multimeric flavodoxin WrbA